MLPQVLAPQLEIPKYIPHYHSPHSPSRSKLSSHPFFLDISHLVSTTISPIQSHSPTDTVDDDIPSPHSPHGSSGNYHYVYRGSASFDSPISQSDMYEHGAHYPPSSHSFKSAPASEDRYNVTNNPGVMNKPNTVNHYLSDSPSPVDVHPTSPQFAPDLQQPRAVPASYRPQDDRFNALSNQRPLEDVTEYSSGDDSQNTLLDHRRMSEPAILGGPNTYGSHSDDIDHPNHRQPFNFNPPALNPPRSSVPAYVPSLHRGTSIGSLRDVRSSQYELEPSTHRLGWKDDSHRQGSSHRADGLDTPISPLQPNFTGSLESPTSGLFSPGAESYYGPSPPNTGTSTSSAPVMSSIHHRSSQMSHDGEKSPRDPSSKTYSFVALPGNAVKKRPRRRYDEIERLYHCAWPDCSKAYGTLNHLNAHVTMQKHGPKRNPNEFKELRKQWRKAKKGPDSPVSSSTRRRSLSARNDDHDIYNFRRYNSHSHTNHPTYGSSASYQSGAGLSSSAASQGERYARDDQMLTSAYQTRPRYNDAARASWHGGATSHEINAPQYISASLPTESHIHHGYIQHPNNQSHYSLQAHPSRPLSPTQMIPSRLPPDSTLLTPLPGYHPPSLLPPLQVGGELNYPSDSYDIYDDENRPRPSTGHASIGYGSADEY